MKRLVTLVVALLAPALALSQTSCPRWAINYGSTTITGEPAIGHDPEASCYNAKQLFEAHYAATGNNNYVVNTWAVTGSGTTRTCTFNYSTYAKSNGAFISNGSVGYGTTQSGTMTCPEDPCAATAAIADNPIELGASSVSGQLCASDDGDGGIAGGTGGLYGKGCRVVKAGAGLLTSSTGHWYGQVRYTGASCAANATPINDSSTANCVASGGGSLCISKTEQSCGTVNGENVCLDDVPPGNCMLLANGGAICDSAATTVPTAEGAPATASGQMTHNALPTGGTEATTQTLNYYPASTVAASGTSVVGVGNPSYSLGGGSSSTPTAAEVGQAVGEAVADALQEDAEAAGALGTPELDEVSTVEETGNAYVTALQSIPLVAAFSGVAATWPAGSCPSATFAWLDGSPMDLAAPACGLWESAIAPGLSLLMLALWGWIGIRIVMEA